jgi:hypothetical protein
VKALHKLLMIEEIGPHGVVDPMVFEADINALLAE